MESKAYAKRILAMAEKDRQIRDQLLRAGQLNDGYHPLMEAVHQENALELDKITDQIGYPSAAQVGKEASQAAWVIIQHAIGQPAFMKKCLGQLKRSVDQGEGNAVHMAYLQDRVLVLEGKKQLYGTQFDWDENGQMSPQPYDNLYEVNRRRQSSGLNKLDEQCNVMRKRIKKENQLPPLDWQQRQRSYEAWRVKVGWIH